MLKKIREIFSPQKRVFEAQDVKSATDSIKAAETKRIAEHLRGIADGSEAVIKAESEGGVVPGSKKGYQIRWCPHDEPKFFGQKWVPIDDYLYFTKNLCTGMHFDIAGEAFVLTTLGGSKVALINIRSGDMSGDGYIEVNDPKEMTKEEFTSMLPEMAFWDKIEVIQERVNIIDYLTDLESIACCQED